MTSERWVVTEGRKDPEPGGYEQYIPEVKEHLEVFERVRDRVRADYAGHPVAEVRAALVAAFEQVGLKVWPEVVDDTARVIAGSED
jgi:hypothetical protein